MSLVSLSSESELRTVGAWEDGLDAMLLLDFDRRIRLKMLWVMSVIIRMLLFEALREEAGAFSFEDSGYSRGAVALRLRDVEGDGMAEWSVSACL